MAAVSALCILVGTCFLHLCVIGDGNMSLYIYIYKRFPIEQNSVKLYFTIFFCRESCSVIKESLFPFTSHAGWQLMKNTQMELFNQLICRVSLTHTSIGILLSMFQTVLIQFGQLLICNCKMSLWYSVFGSFDLE